MWLFQSACRLNEYEISTKDFTLASDKYDEEKIKVAITYYGAKEITDRNIPAITITYKLKT
jgi:hypothetical protein